MFIKKYLSYSQYSCYLFSPAEYIKRYLEGIKQESKYLDFGSLIHKALESGTDDENIKKVISQIPIPEMKEKDYLIDFYGIPIFGKIDGLTIKNGIVRIDEYKTGKNTWTQKKVDEAEQILFYCILVSWAEKIPIENIEINLHWLQTFEDTDGQMYLTGRVETFKTKRTKTDIVNIYPKIRKVWKGIDNLINNYLKNNN